ncbi:MAG: CoA transferase [Thermoflexaceae bacterium]|nr:CoA transferase [Thermoflexaceae bacterium]
MSGGERPLADVVVLDLSDEATVFAGKLLADLGATVVRVEDLRGDGVRWRPPFLRHERGVERSLAHLLFNAGKKSVALDIRADDARAVVLRLAVGADVVLGPLEPAAWVSDMLDEIETAGGSVVRTVFRRGAPQDVATDLVAVAAGGLLTLNGFPEDPPNYPAGQLGYKEASLAAAEAALALVMQCRKDGQPATVTVSLQEAVNFTTIQSANANWLHWQGRVPTRHTPLSPFTTHKTADAKWVSFTVHPPNWPRYAEWASAALNAPELRDPKWSDATYRAANNRELAGYTARLVGGLTREQVITEGQKLGLLVLPVNGVAEIAADKHLLARGFFEDVTHPAVGETVRLPRTAFLSTVHGSEVRPAPGLGADTGAMLAAVGGFSAGEIDALFASGMVAGNRAGETNRPVPVHVTADRAVTRHQPLRGVRVVDFCWAIAGPLATRLLADLGADVIKVESEYRLDPIRQIGVQPPSHSSWNTNGQFNDSNTNKRAMTLNLNTPEGIEIARQLIETADVVTSNYTPDRLDKWGLGYETLKKLKPDIILANWAVMGTRGPHKDWRSYGSGIVAMCGLADLTGFPGRDPIGLGTLHTDFTVPYFAATQVMAALLQRERTGKGQYLEIAQYEASVHLLDTELVEWMNNGGPVGRRGNRSEWMAPHGVYRAAGEDRWVAVACRGPEDWGALCGVAGLEGLRVLDRFDDVDAVEQILEGWTSERDRWEGAALLQAAGVPASAVEDLGDLLGPDEAMADSYRAMALPAGVTALVQEEPILWDGERLPLVRALMWSEHTYEVLQGELGLSDEAVAELAAKNVLF